MTVDIEPLRFTIHSLSLIDSYWCALFGGTIGFVVGKKLLHGTPLTLYTIIEKPGEYLATILCTWGFVYIGFPAIPGIVQFFIYELIDILKLFNELDATPDKLGTILGMIASASIISLIAFFTKAFSGDRSN